MQTRRTVQDRGPDFQRLANTLSALYTKGSEKKRLLDGMLLAVPRKTVYFQLLDILLIVDQEMRY